jgi:hypothetical protein
MKVYINKYKDHWISPYTILEYIFFWTDWSKCGRNIHIIADEDYIDHPKWVEKLVPHIEPISYAIKFVWDLIDRKIDYVKIDRWDTWSMDSTLTKIILPMLKQLKEQKQGSPHVEDEDVPEYLRSHMAQPKEHEWDTDDLWHMRWEWVINEMVFAFEKLNEDDWEAEFYTNKQWNKEGYDKINERIQNGLTLFGKYYRGLWN